MRIEFSQRDRMPQNLVAEIELYFDTAELQGLKLVGLNLWRGEKGLWVTCPARSYNDKTGERKFFDFLRSADSGALGKKAMYRLKDRIVDEWCKKSGEQPPARPDFGGDSDEVPF